VQVLDSGHAAQPEGQSKIQQQRNRSFVSDMVKQLHKCRYSMKEELSPQDKGHFASQAQCRINHGSGGSPESGPLNSGAS